MSFPSTPRDFFNIAYNLAQPPILQSLNVGEPWGPADAASQQKEPPTGAARWAICAQAQAQGYKFDEQIQGYGWDPFSTMSMRELDGDEWVEAGQGNVSAPMGVEPPAQNVGPMPAGAIRVSTVLADYPPFAVPAAGAAPTPSPIPVQSSPVGGRVLAQNPSGANFVGDIFNATSMDGWAVGSFWPASGTGTVGAFSGQWQKQALEMGMWIAWVKVS
jgi:hypothetical protein